VQPPRVHTHQHGEFSPVARFGVQSRREKANAMIGAALGLVVLGVILLFLFPWAGVVVGGAGVFLMVLFLVGFRPARADRSPIDP
jgi:4-hydroxybenzoate polyprenyltransferase